MTYTSQDLVEINEQIAELEAKRGEIMKYLRFARMTDHTKLTGDKKVLYEFVATNPGADRKQIEKILPHLSLTELTNLLTTMRRNRGLIENRGTRTFPSWYIV